ncbi:MBL fold metallo-hydrolase [Kineosporia rhizophila]|uniref:MBL fold metallo-hydrolase n=1 Tax=Kineosporia TaxID=49184 RepID=UPI001E5CF1B1|nr:MBL fold metallo-hydrolase [Kineosporia sp. NBRC 101677]MCE0539361.1 MBL fold metallo-hydrolase [Kineosporia rhizophila]GLY19890.1 MBL fold metallo-hydrolase [Kineosporia sp. NBRC 101677]
MNVTHVGGPTVLLEMGGWRILTDPTFDPPGRRYNFGWGSSSRKTVGPALDAKDIGPIDLILLSHDHHADNLDDLGRSLLPLAGKVVTTVAGAGRLGLPNVVGMQAWESRVFRAEGKSDLKMTATPCRHGPPLSRPIVGQVIGFVLEPEDQQTIWMTGDTVLTKALGQVSAQFDVDVVLLHLGGVRFPITGPLRYSMTGRDALRLIEQVHPGLVLPVHYEGWAHFAEQRTALDRVFETAPASVRERVKWLPLGEAVSLPRS